MAILRTFTPAPLARAILRTSALLLVAGPAGAVTVVDGSLSIDETTALDRYVLNSGATLNATGASVERVDARDNARLNMQGSTVNASGADAIMLRAGAQADIGNDTRIISDRLGLRLQRVGTAGSTATVSDSRIEGGQGGALVSGASTLNLVNSTVVSTGEFAAVELFGNGVLNAQDSTLTGANAGLSIQGDTDFDEAAQVRLVNTRVQGLNGSAIVVGEELLDPAKASIFVGPGTTLEGSNGVLLDVVANSDATLQVDGAQLVGDVRVQTGSTANLALDNQASLTGRLENVAGLTLANQARWTMVEDSQVGALTLSGGAVRFGEADQYQRLSLGSLSGNGTFIMDADFSTGQTDFLDVGTATGNHTLLVGSSGADPVTENDVHLIHTAAGDASFALLNGPVDVGTFSYELVQRGNDWFLDGASKVISPGTESVLALFNTAPTVWYGELTSLRSRMGELRLNESKAGAWGRAYGNKYNVDGAAGSAYTQTQQGFSLGADAPLSAGDGQWLIGVMAGHSASDLNMSRGASAQVKSYYLGLYTTWLDAQSGYYFDGVVKANRFANDSKVTLSDGARTKGRYDNLGAGVSIEFGRHLALAQGYFIEPYTQWSAATIQGKDYRLDNGMRANGDDTRSLLGKAGVTLGKTFTLSEGRHVQPYVRLAYAHEFVDDNEVKVNANRFNNDVSGSRGEIGTGVAVSFNDRLQLHADFDYASGGRVEQPWGANVGLRFSW
ncbi:autotransporter outer membrane beta-barrel domain-containing protein [Pseudomonas parafulva]|uniref:autotransporter outer membrane beta-barrel domain-containing protein n=1 Tax=Pseudomonas parafulva TaxID=157782 RepID=UPI000491E0C6|nr:autotransporter outer membrane beta-barrel domain-containing protein [Pseudomonas parafulva]